MSYGGWGERKRERAGHDGKEKDIREAPVLSLFPSSRRASYFSITAIYIGIPSGSLCGGERGAGERK